MQVNLRGQVALVTGAARGIGRAIADRLAANGARVVYSDIDYEEAKAAARAVEGAMALALDVADADQGVQGVAGLLATHGRLDILVNNAGINTLRPHAKLG
jgi:NAD(P)-dependent dehydrogenase (short-subunit alcohol dehydrogenase family)